MSIFTDDDLKRLKEDLKKNEERTGVRTHIRYKRSTLESFVVRLETAERENQVLLSGLLESEITKKITVLEMALQKMLSPEMDWENGAIGVGNDFRRIAREALEHAKRQ
jgi:hypothetical protein